MCLEYLLYRPWSAIVYHIVLFFFCIFGRGERDNIKLFLFVFPRQIKSMNRGLALFMVDINGPFLHFLYSWCVVYFSNKAFIFVLIVDSCIIKKLYNNSCFSLLPTLFPVCWFTYKFMT